ncbi:unnamed protein product, partial [Auanema sp. JU1783]
AWAVWFARFQKIFTGLNACVRYMKLHPLQSLMYL